MDVLRPVIARAIESAASALLALDSDTAKRLEELDGRTVALHLKGLEVCVYLTVRGERLEVSETCNNEVDATLRAAPGALFANVVTPEGTGAGRVHITGDAHIAQQMQKLLKRLKPDWEEPFAKTFGDVLGPRIARSIREGFDWSVATGGTLLAQLSEYLREESDHLVSRTEMRAFVDEVDALREAADRLEARITRLASSKRE